MPRFRLAFFVFLFNDTAATEIYTLSLHDALPILDIGYNLEHFNYPAMDGEPMSYSIRRATSDDKPERSEEHTSELQSQSNLVCRLLLEKKKTNVDNQLGVALAAQHDHQVRNHIHT